MIVIKDMSGNDVFVTVEGVVWEVRCEEAGPIVFDTITPLEAIEVALSTCSSN